MEFVKKIDRTEKQINAKNLVLLTEYNKSKDEKLKRQITLANIPLVNKIASRYIGVMPGLMDFDDLVHEGVIGLLTAIDRFNIDLGNQFSTYAYPWIKQSMIIAIGNASTTIRLPYNIQANINKINSVKNRAWKSIGNINLLEIASLCNMTIETYSEMITIEYRYRNMISLNTSINENDEILMMIDRESSLWREDEIDLSDPEQFVSAVILKEELKILYDKLTEREKQIIRLRFGIGADETKTLAEIRDIVGISSEGIRKIEVRALKKLNTLSDGIELEEFII